jgi:diaminopimelate decarboxylase
MALFQSYPGVTWVHSVSANANPKLLQVLLMAGVRLATTTRSDLAHALDAQSKLKKPAMAAANSSSSTLQKNRIADSTARSAPPDSYIRELLNARVFAITIDGADEVHRVVRTVQRMQARHGGNSHGIKLELTLCLPSAARAAWLATAKDALAALEAYPVHELSGISLDVGVGGGATSSSADTLQRQVEAERVKDLILKVNPSVKIHLTGFEGDSFPEEWVAWWATQRADSRVREVSVECSFPLIASAGALCTRIIGVRANVAERKQQLYIDDGCYGSLYQTKGDLTPIPLGNYGGGADPAAEQASYTTTVWGPTCDGLDRVCRDIALPKLERDEWVVFPNLGCPGAQGTAFNGFEPPDTAYCVLGYFK